MEIRLQAENFLRRLREAIDIEDEEKIISLIRENQQAQILWDWLPSTLSDQLTHLMAQAKKIIDL